MEKCAHINLSKNVIAYSCHLITFLTATGDPKDKQSESYKHKLITDINLFNKIQNCTSIFHHTAENIQNIYIYIFSVPETIL